MLSKDQRRGFFTRLGKWAPATRLPGLRGMLGDIDHCRRTSLEALLQADVVIAPSRALQQLYEANGVPKRRLRHIPYGHDCGWTRQVEWKPSDHLRFAFLGNVTPVKGLHTLVHAFDLINHRDGSDDSTLDIYGYAGDEEYAAQLQSSSPPNVFWHGPYDRAALGRILSQTDVVVVPSVWHENGPLVIQEAFAAQVPVIASDLSGMAEYVRHGVNGLLAKHGDAADLATQIQRVIDNPGLLASFRQEIPPVRTVEEEVSDLLGIYGGLVCSVSVP